MKTTPLFTIILGASLVYSASAVAINTAQGGTRTTTQGAAVAKVPGAKVGRVQAATGTAELLVRAYTLMHQADHDYHGHRIHAMRLTEEAGKRLGLKLRGDGKADEKQGVSDEQMREARGVLEQALGQLEAEKRNKAAKEIKSAIEQIDIGLKLA